MHLEPPNVRLESLKDFARHYLMIVLSILTALGLEAWIEHSRHQHAAATASAQIEAEIRQNRADIVREREHDFERMQALQKVRDMLLADIRSHASDDVIKQHLQAATPDGLYLDWRWPVLRHEAWDVAVANQSASWIDSERLHRYAAVYAAQNAASSMMAEDLPSLLDGPKMLDTIVDLQTDNLQPREVLHTVNQMASVTNEVTHFLDNLGVRIDTAMAGKASAQPGIATASPANSVTP
ncbi:hypothetical protein ISP15_07060 [Dyella jejuensis]|uniref:Uncharacterized protein n=1 Tax=Dyella jejuensis TaxID=1432009 RepID=A0ABW8JGG5_9GAMM